MSTFKDLQQIRERISNPPLFSELRSDPPTWDHLCKGLDAITDGANSLDRRLGLDAARTAIGMEPVAPASDAEMEDAIEAGLTAMRVELDDRVARWHQRFADDRLTTLLEGTGYMLEKAASATRAATSRSNSSSTGYDRVMGVDALTDRVDRLRAGLIARGLHEEHHTSDADDAIYILKRATALLDGGVSGEVGRDVDLLVRWALPVTIDRIRQLAADVDEDFQQSAGGWSSRP